jgi:hypothetical protein
MRRATIALAAAALLGGGCAGNGIPRDVAANLQRRVQSVRLAAEASKPVLARTGLQGLTTTVATLVDHGVLAEDRAVQIVAAADAVRDQLAVLPAASRSPSPPPSPSPSGEEDHGNGKDKGKGNGHGHD